MASINNKPKKCFHSYAPVIENKYLVHRCIECNFKKINKPVKAVRKKKKS